MSHIFEQLGYILTFRAFASSTTIFIKNIAIVGTIKSTGNTRAR